MNDKMKIFPVISNDTNSNTYILLDRKTRKYCIIDPGYSSAHLQAKEIYEMLKLRMEIEIMFDAFKNVLNADRPYLGDDHKIEG